jgi:FHA domain-containing protein
VATLERIGPGGHELVLLDESRGCLSVGKSGDNDLVIDGDGAVSRVHAKLDRVGPAWCLTDLRSTNGTIVNGERVSETRALADRDEIIIGRTRLIVHDPGAGGERTTEPLRHAPSVTKKEKEVMIELCRPVLSGQTFNPPASDKEMAPRLFITEQGVRQHLGHLYDKFGIVKQAGESRRVRLANEAIQTGAVTMRDLRPVSTPPPTPNQPSG